MKELANLGIQQVRVPTPFPVGAVNVYVIDDPELTLIDSGPNLTSCLEALREGLADLGHPLEEVRRVIVTHEHSDHYGLLREVVQASGAQVFCHAEVADIIEAFSLQREKMRLYFLDLYRELGVPASVIEEFREISRSSQGLRSETRVDVPLRDRDHITFARLDLEVLHTPGHSRGSLCLYDRTHRVLFSGDHLLSSVTSNPVIEAPPEGSDRRPQSLVDYLGSLRRIQELEVEVVLPAHGESIYDHRERIGWIFQHHLERKEQVATILATGEKTSFEVSQALFGDLPLYHLFMGLSEAVGHLELLVNEGRAQEIWTNGVVRFRAS